MGQTKSGREALLDELQRLASLADHGDAPAGDWNQHPVEPTLNDGLPVRDSLAWHHQDRHRPPAAAEHDVRDGVSSEVAGSREVDESDCRLQPNSGRSDLVVDSVFGQDPRLSKVRLFRFDVGHHRLAEALPRIATRPRYEEREGDEGDEGD
jgi:hypothetical protein